MMSRLDDFADIARHYDHIMDHVDYDRWFLVVTQLARLLPRRFRHLDAACGTGTLLKMLRRAGWNGAGVDLSMAMLRIGKKGPGRPLPAAMADVRAVPFKGSADLVTCLFDSMNFLLDMTDFHRALDGFYEALSEDGILYFDVVTERMVSDHYEDQTWVENNGRFSTTWENDYDRRTGVIVTRIRVNTGAACHLRERVYSREEIEQAVKNVGLQILGVYDAHSWKAPNRKTTRLDFVAAKGDPRPLHRTFREIREEIQEWLAG